MVTLTICSGIFGKIMATSLSLGSGGSGGVITREDMGCYDPAAGGRQPGNDVGSSARPNVGALYLLPAGGGGWKTRKK